MKLYHLKTYLTGYSIPMCTNHDDHDEIHAALYTKGTSLSSNTLDYTCTSELQ